jgi:hypothetical protein
MSISITPRLISKFQADGGKQTLAGLRVERSKQVREPVAMPKLIGSLWTGDDEDRCFDINIIHAVLAGSDCGCAKYKTGCFTQVQLDMGQRWADDILVMREKQRGRTGRNPNTAKNLTAALNLDVVDNKLVFNFPPGHAGAAVCKATWCWLMAIPHRALDRASKQRKTGGTKRRRSESAVLGRFFGGGGNGTQPPTGDQRAKALQLFLILLFGRYTSWSAESESDTRVKSKCLPFERSHF